MNHKQFLLLLILLSSLNVIAETEKPDIAEAETENPDDIYQGEDMVITTGHKLFPNTTVATPSFL